MAPEEPRTGGAIAWMARNPVAANLLLLVILIGGLFGTLRTKQEVFPEFSLDQVAVVVPYPGASPAEVEQGVVLATEEAVRGVDGVKRVTAESAEGVGTVIAELELDADPDKVTSDIQSAVDRIRSFPAEAEDPEVRFLEPKRRVVSLVVAADTDLSVLHAIAERARADLIASGEVTTVEIEGVPPLEIAIEVSQEALQALGLTHEDVARQIRAASVEMPGGAVETSRTEFLVRYAGRARTGAEFADLLLRATPDGAEVRLGDVATITDGYADTDLASFYGGRPAVRVTAYRSGAETPRGVSAAVRAEADRLRAELPEDFEVAIWDDDSTLLDQRIDLLVRNGRTGLLLVVVVLALLLRLRLAFWVAVGIPASFLGAFLVMPAADISINMVSLFAFIVTLGMVVDDAIIIGENIYAKIEAGRPKLAAAIEGTREMAMPVSFSILTTMVAFAPLLFVPGTMGKIFGILPVVVLSVLFFSLMESFFVLPAHLAHVYTGPERGILAWIDVPRAWVGRGLAWFTDRVYAPLLEAALGWRYAAIGASVGLLAITVGLRLSGIVPWNFFPVLEGDTVTVTARLPYGTPIERTMAVRRDLERAALQAVEASGEDLLVGMFATVGRGPSARGPGGGGAQTGSHLLTVELALVPSAERETTGEALTALWREATPPQPGVESLVFNANVGPGGGTAIDLQLSHPDMAVLAAASRDLLDVLRSYPALVNVESAYSAGKPQIDYALRPAGRALGLTGIDVARQIRASFHGVEALREQRERNELKVMVRLPEAERTSEHALDRLLVRTPAGRWVPLSTVATWERGRAPTSISREDGRRVIDVSAGKRPDVADVTGILDALARTDLPALEARYPGLEVDFVGRQREQSESLSALLMNYGVALVLMYALIAIPFRSYVQPIIVMTAIPFGVVGAVLGHLVMGMEVSIISLFGMVALSGVVVNDSLVLVDAANQARLRGMGAAEAIRWGARRRLRPILLTSLTTFFGLVPMMAETSVQARFLIPMAVSLGYGVLFATGIILVIVPSLYLVVEDARDAAGRVWRWLYPPEEEAPSAAP